MENLTNKNYVKSMLKEGKHPQLAVLISNMERVLVGKREALELTVVALLAGGHVLLEDVPGVGKTLLVRTLARSLGLSFKRIQFTADLLPSDITGVTVYNQKTGEFSYRPGPVMCNIVLADEINRAPSRTQAALLEAMGEESVTVDGDTLPLPKPFLVLATQNPIDFEGTYPLPEAQLDRFFLRLSLGYPSPAEEIEMLDRLQVEHPLNRLEAVLSGKEVLALQDQVREVYVEPTVKEYMVNLVNATRHHPALALGASPRATLSLQRAAQALAFLHQRTYVLPDDVQALAGPVLAHRLLLKGEGRLGGPTAEEILAQVISAAPVPAGRRSRMER